jgi:hypothetical protein
MIEKFATWLFRWRTPLIIGFAILTGFMAWSAAHLRVDASFNKSLPLDHPYIRTFTKHQAEFGGANRVPDGLRAKRHKLAPDAKVNQCVRPLPQKPRERRAIGQGPE